MKEISQYININTLNIDKNQINEFVEYILEIYENNSRVFIYGAGRSGFIGRCFAQRLMHLGVKSCFISDAVTPQ